jgi:DNA polymerase
MTSRRLHLDVETCSEVDLSAVGAHVYFAHPSTRLICACWAYEDGEPKLWVYGQPKPDDLCQAIDLGLEVHAFNASFEIEAMRMMAVRHEWPDVPVGQWRDTRAKALAFAIPGSLGGACKAMGVEHQKDDAGHRVMLQLCKPASLTKNCQDPWRLHTQERLDTLYAYCAQDVKAERALDAALPDLSENELNVWRSTQRLNDRGVCVDRDAITAATALLASGRHDWGYRCERASGGYLASGGGDVQAVAGPAGGPAVGRIKEWLTAKGRPVISLDKEAVADLLKVETDSDIRTVLEARQALGKTSLAKIPVLAESSGADGRVRGCFTYHGATTGRWTSQRAQMQNLPRDSHPDLDAVMADVGLPFDEFSMLWGDPFAVLSRCIKGFFTASPDEVLVAGDYSQIEARMVLWLAEDAGLDLFARGGAIYEEVAAAIYKVPVSSITRDGVERRVGKETVLGAGYGLGAPKFHDRLQHYGIFVPIEVAEAAITGYRERFPAVPKWWKRLEQAAVHAIKSPGLVFELGRGVKFRMTGKHLQCRLPSGRKITWPFAEVAPKMTPWGEERDAVFFMEESSMTHQWSRSDTYGGKLAENVASGAARDLMAEAMLRAERAGYAPLLTVHDELVCETDDSQTLVPDFQRILCAAPAWAAGLPIKAECWKGQRYG